MVYMYLYEGVPISCCDAYEEGDGDIHIRDVTCDSSETNITSCTYFNNTVPITHQHDVGVKCRQGLYYINSPFANIYNL